MKSEIKWVSINDPVIQPPTYTELLVAVRDDSGDNTSWYCTTAWCTRERDMWVSDNEPLPTDCVVFWSFYPSFPTA